jgi:hypothetical protein
MSFRIALRRRALGLAAAAIALHPVASMAVDADFYINSSARGIELAQWRRMSQLSLERVKRSREATGAAPAAAVATSTVFTPQRPPGAGARKLAATYPDAKREQAAKVFLQLLGKYGELETKLGVQHNDLAGAMAAYVYANYSVMHDQDVPDEHFPPLVAQMQRFIGGSEEFARMSDADKQDLYEQTAIVGMLMATSRLSMKSQPQPQVMAQMKTAARHHLEQVLHTDANRVEITASGLVVH